MRRDALMDTEILERADNLKAGSVTDVAEAAELVAASTIGVADVLGLPVSTTHVLSSGVAGTMAANGSGLQWEPCATSPWPGC